MLRQLCARVSTLQDSIRMSKAPTLQMQENNHHSNVILTPPFFLIKRHLLTFSLSFKHFNSRFWALWSLGFGEIGQNRNRREMRHCRGAQSLRTLDKINFWFSPNNFCVKFKTKITNINPESNIYENFFSSPVGEKRRRVFCIFHEAPFFCTKGMNSLEERSQAVATSSFSASHAPSKSVSRLVWKKPGDTFYLSLWKRSSNYSSSWLQLDTHYDICNRGEVAVRRRFVFLSIHRKKQMHKPSSSSSYCFLVLEPLARQ